MIIVLFLQDTGICGPIGILSGGVNVPSLKDKSSFARFGAAIASMGDLDLDGYNGNFRFYFFERFVFDSYF
jgi:hypothetical protein